MTTLQVVLAQLIRQGKVTVEIPNLDMDQLCDTIWTGAVLKLEEIGDIVYTDEMTDHEKVVWIQQHLKMD